ncbi:MAG: DEAD/DEAH box helicase [Chloroflexi bacterium]|uniref:DNA 3'-5' helicase n=1 Tax=Candidatus Chlorohelix allophototropha TaxID=3003348 RepID=A0A8T7LUJ8_9CHLR|nr:DEAD/DEAH box helicase [Chloroflexota bacterium]WJW66454.1 DEAD/DEAH box helicase [Chloroflexota bacterium L227-S17]
MNQTYNPLNPLIIQSDKSVLLEVNNPQYEDARNELSRFAELEKSPEYIHTYRITPLSLWNAAAAGMGADLIVEALARYSKFPLPGNIIVDIKDYISRYGRIKLEVDNGRMVLRSTDKLLITEVERSKSVSEYVWKRLDEHTIEIDPARRGFVKQALVAFGYPAEDLAGYVDGERLDVALRNITLSGKTFGLRDYQMDAAGSFYAGGSSSGGSGVIVLPCGAGKTVVGMGVMDLVQAQTLILTTNTIAVRQWITEILDKTTLTADQVGEYTGDKKEIKPVTVTTYQMITYRPMTVNRETGEVGAFPHLQLFTAYDWGLIIYDEVHLLPAPVFRITAEIQARRRLGLTATLVREDNHETDVFSLIGPKKYDMPWKELEENGWIATAECYEIRTDLPQEERMEYVLEEDNRVKYRISAISSRKYALVNAILRKHTEDHVLVIGQYLEQLGRIAAMIGAPLITGKTPNVERAKLYSQFKSGEIKVLVVSRVANFAIDLPDANVAIQVSGLFGSRQEEAQRLGRILRPKSNGLPAYFYSIVTRDTRDQDFAANRQLFLTEQGYRYTIIDSKEFLEQILGVYGEEFTVKDLETHLLPPPPVEPAYLEALHHPPTPDLDEDSPTEEESEFQELETRVEQQAKSNGQKKEERKRNHLRIIK